MIFMGDEDKDNPAYDVDELKKVNVPDLKNNAPFFVLALSACTVL